MNNQKYLVPSILNADFSNLAQQVRYVEMGAADWIHCDVMDGRFVPNLTFGSMIVEAINKITKLPLDVHLMIKEPDNLIEEFINAGADHITIHQEEVIHLNRSLMRIKELGAKAGVAINPSTPVDTLKEIIEITDLVLIMSVNPGFGGQKFIESSLRKIRELADIRAKTGKNFIIEIDGGIDKENILKASEAGCNAFVIGSAIYHSDNITAATVEFKNLISG